MAQEGDKEKSRAERPQPVQWSLLDVFVLMIALQVGLGVGYAVAPAEVGADVLAGWTIISSAGCIAILLPFIARRRCARVATPSATPGDWLWATAAATWLVCVLATVLAGFDRYLCLAVFGLAAALLTLSTLAAALLPLATARTVGVDLVALIVAVIQVLGFVAGVSLVLG